MEYFAKLRLAVVCALAVLMLQGCDWVKGQMGMPTSDDIARMRMELSQKEELEKAAREKALQDSLAMAVPKAEPVGGYHVVIGSFKDYGNADALVEFVGKMGHSARTIRLKNGYMMVSIGEHATLPEAVAQMRKIEGTEVCPYDVWVYSSAQGLHEEE